MIQGFDIKVLAKLQTIYDLITSSPPGSTTWGSIVGTLSSQTDLQNALNAKVPYTGATTNVDLGEYQIKSGQVEFDQTPTGTTGVAVMRWNDADGTVDLGMKGGNVTLQIGQELLTRVVNKTGSDLLEANYQAVRISGAQGNRLKVDLAQANNDPNSAETLGIVTETIIDNDEGFITTSGLVRGINTTGSLQSETWADGDMLYLSGTVAGQLTNIKPTAPIHTVIMGYVVRAHITQGQIYVKVDNGYELDELHNVAISSPTNGQVLTYNSATSLWSNVTPTAGSTTQIFAFQLANVAAANATTWVGIGVTGGSNESTSTLIMPVACTLSDMYTMHYTTAQPATGAQIFTVRKNGVDTALVITIAAGSAPTTTPYSNLANSVSFAVGDKFALRRQNLATTTGGAVNGLSFKMVI